MAIEAKIVTSKSQWEKFIRSQVEANFLQSWMWGDVNEKLDRKVFRVGYFDGKKMIGAMIAELEDARRGRYLAVAAGPIIDWNNMDLAWKWKDSINDIATDNDCVFVRVRPQLESSKASLKLFKKLGLRPAKMHLEAELTSQLDLSASIEEINKNFRKNTRREIKQAKKRGIVVTKTDDPSEIEAFYRMQLATAKRHKFVPFSLDRLQAEFDVFAESNNVLLYSAHTKDKQLIAQAYVIFYGEEASYHYGASTELGRKEPGAYAIQWAAIKEAKNRGCSRYNFWGVVKEDEKKHRFYGVSVFKRGFRGSDVEYLHAHDLVIQGPAYLKNYAIETVRKRIRRL